MSWYVRSPKDFWAGVLYAAFGGAGVFIAAGEYPMGTGARMGPGYFPIVLGVLLLGFGLACLVRAFARAGEPIGAIAWKPLGLVTLATVLFGLLLPSLGLIVALFALALVAAAASRMFRFDLGAAAGLVALVAACAVVFVVALGVPLPLLGSWLSGGGGPGG